VLGGGGVGGGGLKGGREEIKRGKKKEKLVLHLIFHFLDGMQYGRKQENPRWKEKKEGDRTSLSYLSIPLICTVIRFQRGWGGGGG